MQIEILDFFPNINKFKVGTFDFRLIHEQGKWELFRNVGYFKRDNRRWINLVGCKRNDKWVPTYERSPDLKDIMPKVLESLEKWIDENKEDLLL